MTDTGAPNGTESARRTVVVERREMVEKVDNYNAMPLPEGMTAAEFQDWSLRDPVGFDRYIAETADPDCEDYEYVTSWRPLYTIT